MVGEVFAGLGAFKAMFDMAKALKDINDATIRNGAVIELQEQILGAQVAQAALLERVSYLEAEMGRLEAWNAEKQRYELKRLTSGALVYSLKADESNAEPPHDICAACYQRGKKFHLQKVPQTAASAHLMIPPMSRCPECKSDIVN